MSLILVADRMSEHEHSSIPSKENAEKKERAKITADEDRQLIKLFIEGDVRAFEKIVARHREKVFSIALIFLKNRADAEEIAQDTMIRAYRGLRSFRGDSSLATWLQRIAVNLSRNRYWYYHRRKRHTTISFDKKLTEESTATLDDVIPDERADPMHELSLAEFEILIQACLSKLKRTHKEMLEMRLKHRTYDEIATAFCIDAGTVKSRMSRAREQLLGYIAKTCPELRSRDDIVKLLRGDRFQSLFTSR